MYWIYRPDYTYDFKEFKFTATSLEMYFIVYEVTIHSTLSTNLMKMQDPETGPSQGGRAWSRGPKYE